MPNRLAGEPSPYLQQHAGNPVDWYPWGDEAFERARREDKPIFLSIGYSTCHWCHVMEHESFEHPGIAALLNEHFVSIKVDREGAPRRRPRLHGVRAGDDRLGRLAHERLADAGPEAVLRRHLLPAGLALGGGRGSPTCCGRVAARWASSRGEPAAIGRRAARAAARDAGAVDGWRRGPCHSCRRRGRSRRAGRRPCSSSRLPSTRATADSAGRRSFRGRPSCSSCCGSPLAGAMSTLGASRWPPSRRWPAGGCAITSAAASTVTPSMRRGGFRTSRRCSTTRRSSSWPAWRRDRRRGPARCCRWPRTPSSTCAGT